MRNYPIRERILSLVTTPDRAASIVGDLIECGGSPLRFWAAIGSNLLHAMTPRVVGTALAGFIAQFIVFVIPSIALMQGFRVSELSINQFRWCAGLAFLATQILTGYWIGRRSQSRGLLACLIVGLINCVLGGLNVYTASFNMAIWSVPLMAGALLYHRRSLRRA